MNEHSIENLAGKTFGRLRVIKISDERTASGRIKWDVRCACGNTKSVQAINLKSGDTTSCGCVHKEELARRNRTHGGSDTSEYRTWCAMRNRCNNPNAEDFDHYGGRGVRICARWDSFANFLSDMGQRPTPKHTIERRDVDGDYEPANCTWVLQRDQVRNTRSNIRIDDRTILADAARKLGVPETTLYSRVGKLGWSVERAINTPVRPKARRSASLKREQ